MASLALIATLDATALSATLFLSALALLLSALAMSASNLKSKQNCPHVARLQGRVGYGVCGEYFLPSLDSTQSSEMHNKCNTIIFQQDSANEQIHCHEGV
jgi:hypothetical protein